MKNLLPQRGHRACHAAGRAIRPQRELYPSDVERVDADAAREIGGTRRSGTTGRIRGQTSGWRAAVHEFLAGAVRSPKTVIKSISRTDAPALHRKRTRLAQRCEANLGSALASDYGCRLKLTSSRSPRFHLFFSPNYRRLALHAPLFRFHGAMTPNTAPRDHDYSGRMRLPISWPTGESRSVGWR